MTVCPMLEEVIDAVLLHQAGHEGQIGLSILHAVFHRLVALGELELEVLLALLGKNL